MENLDESGKDEVIIYRDSRHAFGGQRFQVEKPGQTWKAGLAGFAAACLVIMAMAWELV